MLSFFQNHALELIGLTVEFVVLLAILREVRELKQHHAALQAHEHHLLAARPLMSTLYTGDDEIMDLAIQFTEQADTISALGTISSLVETERRPGEGASEYSVRLGSVDARKRAYVAATLNRIINGCKYRRIMDLAPRAGNDDEIREALANVRFFLRAFDTPGTKGIDLNLYHNSETMKGRGDFHFRCSNRQLVLRVGGHGNGYANAAILINDTRVIDEFRRYFDSILVSGLTRHLVYEDLERLRDFLQTGDVAAVRSFLESGDLARASTGSFGSGRATFVATESNGVRPNPALPNCIADTAVVLAAGRGNRMGQSIKQHQKCMLPIAGRPLLGWAIDALSHMGVQRVFVLVSYQAEEVIEHLKSHPYHAVVEPVEVSAISTALAIQQVKDRVGEHFWFVHGNVLFPSDTLQRIIDRYTEYNKAQGRYPAASVATVPLTSNLTHAVFRKRRRGEISIIRAVRWNGEKVEPIHRELDVLSLGVGCLNRACIDWDRVSDDGLMVEGLIVDSPEHPIVSVPVATFGHIETDADYRRWSADDYAIKQLLKVDEHDA